MRQAWEVFFTVWASHAQVPDDAGARPVSAAVGAAAISAAARETVRHLRDERGWSLLNSHLMTGQMVEAAMEWLSRGADRPQALRERLREVAEREPEIHREESQWRQVTERILEGAAHRPLVDAA